MSKIVANWRLGAMFAVALLPAVAAAQSAPAGPASAPGAGPGGGALNEGFSIGPSASVASSSVPPLPVHEALVPQVNTGLNHYGVAVLLDNTNEFAGIVSGPRQGAGNAGQYGLEVDIDWERLAGLTGFSTHVVTVGRYGVPASRIFGDEINPSSEIYGAGGNVVNHLVFAYGEETLAKGRVDIQAGRIPLLNNYLASPLYCNFQNNAFCGNPKASSNNGALSSYPDADWALTVRVRPVQAVYIQSGLFFAQNNIYNYAENFRSGWTIDNSYIGGETVPVEVGWEPAFGRDHLPGHYKLGFEYDSNNHDVQFDPDELVTGTHTERKGSTTEWALFDQMLMRNGPGDSDGLIVLGGYVHNDPNVNAEEHQIEIAALDRGFWHARPQDAIDVGLSWTKIGGPLTRQEELEQELGVLPEPTPGKISSETPGTLGATGIQTHTLVLEANYQIHVYRGITFAPDFQYYFRPNAQGNLPDAALIGFKSHVELF